MTLPLTAFESNSDSSFTCRRCGECCRWEGAVKITGDEVDAIAAFLDMSVEEFLEHHTRLTPDRQHLSLIEKANGECEYLTTASDGLPACAIEPVKPRQCREFPAKWNFPGWQNLCKSFSK